jgi:hypothetical protein
VADPRARGGAVTEQQSAMKRPFAVVANVLEGGLRVERRAYEGQRRGLFPLRPRRHRHINRKRSRLNEMRGLKGHYAAFRA